MTSIYDRPKRQGRREPPASCAIEVQLPVEPDIFVRASDGKVIAYALA